MSATSSNEAGHIAMTDPGKRTALRLTPTGGEELSAMAWSYAAGLPLMQKFGMMIEPRNAAARGATPYAHMLRWLR
jgi:hypothetical protein